MRKQVRTPLFRDLHRTDPLPVAKTIEIIDDHLFARRQAVQFLVKDGAGFPPTQVLLLAG